ncbi:hypothetical protein [Pyrobaculum aerophilum]|nr:hypothetical protein [Pyrobaculum aerophilum]
MGMIPAGRIILVLFAASLFFLAPQWGFQQAFYFFFLVSVLVVGLAEYLAHDKSSVALRGGALIIFLLSAFWAVASLSPFREWYAAVVKWTTPGGSAWLGLMLVLAAAAPVIAFVPEAVRMRRRRIPEARCPETPAQAAAEQVPVLARQAQRYPRRRG